MTTMVFENVYTIAAVYDSLKIVKIRLCGGEFGYLDEYLHLLPLSVHVYRLLIEI